MAIILKLLGSLVNCLTVLVGSTIGLGIKKGIPEKYENAVMNAIALSIMFIGISGIRDGQNTIVIIISMVVGTLLGTVCNLDGLVKRFADYVEAKIKAKSKNKTTPIAEGMVTSTLLFCVGAMTVVGSLNSGLKLDHSTLYSKAVLDGIASMVLASSLGFGVLFSVVPLLIYQGGITLLASIVAPLLSQVVISEMSAIGSLLIIALSLNMLKLTNLKVMNMLPAIFLPIAIYMLPIF